MTVAPDSARVSQKTSPRLPPAPVTTATRPSRDHIGAPTLPTCYCRVQQALTGFTELFVILTTHLDAGENLVGSPPLACIGYGQNVRARVKSQVTSNWHTSVYSSSRCSALCHGDLS